ncbi:ATP-grasp domain-containing protein [Vibrio harveyi]|uniref:ATP-grasp domain-containing protein n=1 Tax=Vibrio harveyi TaxID=669 RepID=UPI001EFCDC02|nr:ATP-grasp domain-containing protein [Vibrio harveyi]MCG9612096.1 ATP-grasp domain-containing protein [Vibrio harveyi]MCG9670206.1 ATP-grasp domain-containing protein [Vibrio harveyi]
MSRVLLLDTAFASVPIYNYLIKQGHSVYVMGNRAGDALAMRAGPKWINQDYSQIDSVKHIVSGYGFDYILPGCTDLSIEVCQEVVDTYDIFDIPEAYQHLGDKEHFRKMCAELNLLSPQRKQREDFPLPGRYICKPVDAFSGRGVSVIDGMDADSVANADEVARSVSHTGRSLFETFVEGQLYSYSAFIEQRKVIESFVVIEGSSSNPYAVDTSYVDDEFNEDARAVLKESIEAIAQHLQLRDGLIHLQFILADGQPYLIEITRRCPGDLYSKLIEYSTGFDYAGKFASYFVGKKYKTVVNQTNPVVRHTVSSLEVVSYESLEFQVSVSLKAFYPLLSLGSEVLANQKTRVGIAFLNGNKKAIFDSCIKRNLYKL